MSCINSCRFINVHKLEDHLRSEHNVALTTMTMDFESMDAFLEWKEQEERETHTWYIQRCGAKLGTEAEIY